MAFRGKTLISLGKSSVMPWVEGWDRGFALLTRAGEWLAANVGICGGPLIASPRTLGSQGPRTAMNGAQLRRLG